MCQKRNSRRIEINGKTVRIDGCISNLIETLNRNNIHTIASCCGHGKYNISIITITPTIPRMGYDIVSNKVLPRNKEFYKKNKDGYYYIPEVLENIKNSKGK